MKQRKVRKRERKKSYGEMDGKSSDLRDAVFTGRVEAPFLKLYVSMFVDCNAPFINFPYLDKDISS